MAACSLVTGGLGFIGRHLVERLRQRGERVRVLDLQVPDGEAEADEYVTGSVTDAALVREAMRGVDTVYHLAARSGLWAADRAEFDAVSAAGTRHVLAAAQAEGVTRIVHCSTESVLKPRRASRAPVRVDESLRLTEREMCGEYCRAKLRAENAALDAARRGLPVVVVNPSIPVGPGDRLPTPPTRMILDFLNGRYPAFLDCLLNLVDARDVALGHVLAAEHGRIGERYLLSHENLRLRELLALLETISGRSMPRHRVPYWVAWGSSAAGELLARYVTRRPPAAPLTGVRLARSATCFDNTRARQELGLRFRPLTESLEDAVTWYRGRGLLEGAH